MRFYIRCTVCIKDYCIVSEPMLIIKCVFCNTDRQNLFYIGEITYHSKPLEEIIKYEDCHTRKST
jgi:hypothetical protein